VLSLLLYGSECWVVSQAASVLWAECQWGEQSIRWGPLEHPNATGLGLHPKPTRRTGRVPGPHAHWDVAGPAVCAGTWNFGKLLAVRVGQHCRRPMHMHAATLIGIPNFTGADFILSHVCTTPSTLMACSV
jgi:hypothetical protein